MLPLDASILRWWHDEGGEAVTFGSDAHEPDAIAAGFHDAAAMADELGFRPGSDPVRLLAAVLTEAAGCRGGGLLRAPAGPRGSRTR